MGKHSASIDAIGGALRRQSFARTSLCNRQRPGIDSWRRQSAPSARPLIRCAGMPLGIREVRPAKPQAAAVTVALTGFVAGLIEMRYCLASLLLGFCSCRVHRVLQDSRSDLDAKVLSAISYAC